MTMLSSRRGATPLLCLSCILVSVRTVIGFGGVSVVRTTTTASSWSSDDGRDGVRFAADGGRPRRVRARPSSVLRASTNDDDEDDDEIELGDWRAFRSNLAETGIRTPDDAARDDAADDDGDETTTAAAASSLEPPRRRPRSVSRANEELLRTQSSNLAEEYASGAWAHEIGEVEVGGLVCRMPVEAELRKRTDCAVGRELARRLDLSTGDGDDNDNDDDAPSSVDAPYYEDDNDEVIDESDESDESDQQQRSPPRPRSSVAFSPLAARTMFWYRSAQTLLKEELRKVTDTAENGAIDGSRLTEDMRDFLTVYLENQETWQEVCLVLSRSPDNGAATSVVINRPMALQITSERLARLVLFGVRAADFERSVDVSRTETLVSFLTAFENQCAVYVGGPDDQEEPALMIHGIEDLEGAEELEPGCNIYQGGLKAAIRGVLAGKYSPLDFRFFVGRHSYTDWDLDSKVNLGKYQPIACARTLALKQCIALPKPLWHEVLELCGGELREISNLEMMKRNDIEIEEVFDEDDEEEIGSIDNFL